MSGDCLLLALIAIAMVWALPSHCFARLAKHYESATAPAESQQQPLAERAQSRLALADLSAERGLVAQANALYREILLSDPADEHAYRRLCALADRQPLTSDSAAFQTVRDWLPPAFKEYESKRFIALSNGNPTWTRHQLELLERAHHQFHRFALRLDLRPLPLQHKLLCVMFADREQFAEFAQQHDELNSAWISGYYSPKNDCVVFYDNASSAQLPQYQTQLDPLRRKIAELTTLANNAVAERDLTQAAALRRDALHVQVHLDQQHRQMEEALKLENTATTIHEAIHQLAFHTRVQTPHVHYPIWICEGLATCFETHAPHESFGPDRAFLPRRDRFRQLLADNALLAMRDLISIDHVTGADTDLVNVVYQQSYALVMWMSRYRKKELREYLMNMLTEPPGAPDSNRHLELFEQAFGDVDALERTWLRHERGNLATQSASATTLNQPHHFRSIITDQ